MTVAVLRTDGSLVLGEASLSTVGFLPSHLLPARRAEHSRDSLFQTRLASDRSMHAGPMALEIVGR